jgi:hypothetical protein
VNERIPTGYETEDTDERPQRLSSGMWWVIGLLASSTFVAGLAGGILIDGTAEVINEFNAKNAKSCVPTKAEQAVVVGQQPADSGAAATTATAARQVHPNNEINWMITVAPGTPTAKIEVRNADPEHGARLDFGTTDGTTVRTAATIWIDAAGIANLSLPLGRYAIRTQRLDASQSADGPPTTIPTVMSLASSEDAPTVAGSSSGRWMVTGLDRTADKPASRRRRRSGSDEEYRGLGQSETGGGSPTYG